jgi:hypothetical protein
MTNSTSNNPPERRCQELQPSLAVVLNILDLHIWFCTQQVLQFGMIELEYTVHVTVTELGASEVVRSPAGQHKRTDEKPPELR